MMMMKVVLYVTLFVLSFLGMEGIAYLTHKYVMHGFLWRWHRSHHRMHGHFFEYNDLFGLIFAIPSAVALVFGYQFPSLAWLRPIGYGILGYGIFYVLFHDILVHQRLRFPFLPRKGYLKRMVNAHHAHHRHHQKKDAESFGFLFAAKRYAEKKTIKIQPGPKPRN